VKEEGETDKKPPDNKLTTLAGNLTGLYRSIYRRKYECQSIHGRHSRGRPGRDRAETVRRPLLQR